MSRLLSLRSVVGAPGSLSSVPDVHSAYTRACGLTSSWSGSSAVRGVAAAARAPAGWQEASSTGSASTSGRREFRSSAPRSVALGVVDQLHEEQAIALPSSSRRNFWEVCGRPRELLPAPATRVWSERCCLCTPCEQVIEFRNDAESTVLETWKTPEARGRARCPPRCAASGLVSAALHPPRGTASSLAAAAWCLSHPPLHSLCGFAVGAQPAPEGRTSVCQRGGRPACDDRGSA
jgi:hypothetical protein